MSWKWVAASFCAVVLVGPANADDKKKAKDDDKTLTESVFVDKAYSGGMTEVTMGQMGLAHGSHADVKKFSERLVKDHTKANTELILIVSDLRIAIPEKPLPEHEKHLMHFGEGKAKDFDKEFMKHMVEGHEESIKLFTRASKELKNDRLKAYAEKTLPTLKEHLEMAKKTRDQVAKGNDR